MKKLFFYISILLAAVIFAACQKVETGTLYFYHVSEVNALPDDSIKIENYVSSKNIIKEQAFDAGSLNACDQKAIEVFDQYAAQIKIDEIKDLTPLSSFTYTVSRWKNKDNPYSGSVDVKTNTYVKE
ncbi:MAG: hypothetical protein LBN27_05795 [Prevotellaceae bacterium]|jgi:hypothetical protein|nr:hypothetical protein [Prevotellaceae bacterium]